MSGRTFCVILFCWAALTVITPILVRLSASEKLLDYNGEIKNGVIQSNKEIVLLSRRALGSVGLPPKERPLSSAASLSSSSSPPPSSSSSPSSSPSPSPSSSSSSSPSPSPSPSPPPPPSSSSPPPPSSSSSPSPSPPHRQTTFELEVSGDSRISSIPISKNEIT